MAFMVSSSILVNRALTYGMRAKVFKGEMRPHIRALSCLFPVESSVAKLLNGFSPRIFKSELKPDLADISNIVKPSQLFVSGSSIGRLLDEAVEINNLTMVGRGNQVELRVIVPKGYDAGKTEKIELFAGGGKREFKFPAQVADAKSIPFQEKVEIKPRLADAEFQALCMSPGFGKGQAFLLQEWEKDLDIKKRENLAPIEVKIEISLFEEAVAEAKKELEEHINTIGPQHKEWKDIEGARLAMYSDSMIVDATIARIEGERMNAAYILNVVINEIAERFENIDDPYLARAVDLAHDVGRDLLERIIEKSGGSVKSGEKDVARRASRVSEVVIVADEIRPSDFQRIRGFQSKIKAIVTRKGGPTAHAALIGRELEIPVVSLEINPISEGDLLLADGLHGRVFVNPSEETKGRFEGMEMMYRGRMMTIFSSVKGKPSITKDGVPITLLANISRLSEAELVGEHEGEGIGIYRVELDHPDGPPAEEKLRKEFIRMARAQGLREDAEITLRCWDFGGDKPVPKKYNIPIGADMGLGISGPRVYFWSEQTREILRIFNRAALQAGAEHPGIRIMWPKITVPEEVDLLKKQLELNKHELEDEGKKFNKKMKVGIMLETPSAFNIANFLSGMVDFFSFGTNDLIQYTLLVDRANQYVAPLYDSKRLSVIWPLRRGINAALKRGIEACCCGKMAEEPLSMLILMGLGLTRFSMDPPAIPLIKHLLRSVTMEEARNVATSVLSAEALMGELKERKAKMEELISLHLSAEGLAVLRELENMSSM